MGSVLLAYTRAGMLKTRVFRAHYEPLIDRMCQKCGRSDENLKHIVLGCRDDESRDGELLDRLGLGEKRVEHLIVEAKGMLVR